MRRAVQAETKPAANFSLRILSFLSCHASIAKISPLTSTSTNYYTAKRIILQTLTPKQLTIFQIFIEFAIGCQDEFCAWICGFAICL